ncbi:MAG: acyl-CoA dehydrogenase family protein [Acidimicrobiia bacterium]|nr:acyl-CoA dehydrogenase family protein [Acidimicrobiia bacterium]
MEKRLYDARWSVVAWPEAYGGRDASLWEWLIFEEEDDWAGVADVPPRSHPPSRLIFFEFGTPEQQDHRLRRMAAAEDLVVPRAGPN